MPVEGWRGRGSLPVPTLGLRLAWLVGHRHKSRHIVQSLRWNHKTSRATITVRQTSHFSSPIPALLSRDFATTRHASSTAVISTFFQESAPPCPDPVGRCSEIARALFGSLDSRGTCHLYRRNKPRLFSFICRRYPVIPPLVLASSMAPSAPTHTRLPILDLSRANDSEQKLLLLEELRHALFHIGFLYITNHGIDSCTISNLVSLLPALFEQPPEAKASLSKMNSPHFLGYSGYAEETTLGTKDLREQFDLATELPVVYNPHFSQKDGNRSKSDFSKPYWRLRGPNQWPSEQLVPGFRKAYTELSCLPINTISYLSLAPN